MTRINLLPAERLARLRQKVYVRGAVLAALALVAAAFAADALHAGTARRLAQIAANQDDQIAAVQGLDVQIQAARRALKAYQDRISDIKNLRKVRRFYPTFLSDFVRSVPEGVTVKTLQTLGGGTQAAPLQVEITASVSGFVDVLAWIVAMEALHFSNLDLAGPLSASGSGSDQQVEIKIKGRYAPAL
jgi:Tfp pilus assembly protein PilN